MPCTITTCQAIFHGKCLNADESEFEALRAIRKNFVCPKCEKARKNIQPTDKCLSPPRSAPQQQTVDSTSQLLLAAIKNLTEEVKGLKFSLDANANEGARAKHGPASKDESPSAKVSRKYFTQMEPPSGPPAIDVGVSRDPTPKAAVTLGLASKKGKR
ncbi:unnamed protein product [Nezara viridula]|uniref:Zinc finger PHD-type domain-containing protein n=1 Tax=Nezara viridula TaxID=85310 RepID=A0A9P0EGG0_NEZVI|nr:unnamed protein product [Nezara viridula]